MIQIQCRRIIDISDIRFSFNPFRQREDQPVKEQSQGAPNNKEEETEETTLANDADHSGNNKTITCHESNADCSDGLKCCDSFFRCYRIMGNYICASFLLEGLGALKASQNYQRDIINSED
ncbi:uncharacterized protein TRIADDRAFT_53033 [Trichoplax adhaerens]|uniref:Uncharacterized protein n=1 Tax=Trichoplax adhaerens TaxID=10228 RepID=B3RN44_TRIAD|nr:predicted protein [Trichoplax adhaerens]EDV27957.1 predicted protein [Trichoplax adhaerens]|eukprot:XP_002109791.1 predicted protein [Trichoplax adhaerens]